MKNIFLPFIITFLAGISTTIGYFIIYFKKDNCNNIINNSFSFAAGIMISISILDLIPEGFNLLHSNLLYNLSLELSILGIILGITLSYILENSISNNQNKLYKTGVFSMITIILHNIPEGIITFISSQSNISLGIPLAISIAIHNIPEGIIISLPLYYSIYNKKKTFIYTLISGLSEPLGAIIALLFSKYINNTFLGIIFNVIAGFMIFLSLHELKETINNKYNKKYIILYFLAGVIVCIVNFIL